MIGATPVLPVNLPIFDQGVNSMKTIRITPKTMQPLFYLITAFVWLLSGAAHPVMAQQQDLELEHWQGDFEEMLERRQIRALVVYNKLFYFLDGPVQRGASYDSMQLFQDYINKKFKLKTRSMQIIMVPVSRNDLIPALLDGRGDIALANLTITPERQELVDFSDPFIKDVKEVVVTGPNSPDVSSLADLSGKTIFVRKSSSYYTSLLKLNEQLQANNLDPVELKLTGAYLEDSDLLEMVNAGLMPMIIVDKHKADFWKEIFKNIMVHNDLAITVGGSIGWAFRKNSPTLTKIINQYVKQSKRGTLNGNIILNRYFKNNKWIRNVYDEKALDKMTAERGLFQKYAKQYDFDWLMLMALGFQESGLDQDVRSSVGAIGVMQVLPSTAADANVNIKKIEELENNIHAGTKYLKFLRTRYFDDPNIDRLNQTLLAFAAYNAGPAKVRKLRKEAAERGLDPDVWFGNVEHIAAKRIGRETVRYVANIYKYFIAYTLLSDMSDDRSKAKTDLIQTLE